MVPTVPTWGDIDPTTEKFIHVARVFVNKDGFWIYSVIGVHRTDVKTRSVEREEENTLK